MDVRFGAKKGADALKKIVGFSFAALLILAGCVSIDDPHVSVIPPGEVEQFQRSPLDKCDPHKFPHRLILAEAGSGSAIIQAGSQTVTTQAAFDQWWGTITPQLDNSSGPVANLKPVINWNQEIAVFELYMGDSCMRIQPYGDEVTSDCYTITMWLYSYSEGTDCQSPRTSYPVFIYICPTGNLPWTTQWVYPTPSPTVTSTPIPQPTFTPTPTATPLSDDE